jgi:hypothetical protein
MITVKPVFPNHFHQTWPLVENLFASALKYGGDEYSLDQIKTLLSQGSWVLLVAVDEKNGVQSFFKIDRERRTNGTITQRGL